MINKIESIRDFGIYKSFSWNSATGLKNFNHKNLIMAGIIQAKRLYLEYSVLYVIKKCTVVMIEAFLR